jgi:kynurenine formamidase
MGSLMVADITQAAGLIPFDVMAPKVDFVISTSLKWLCGTPGAGILYADKALCPSFSPKVAAGSARTTRSPGTLDKFQYAPDIRRFDTGTPGSVAAIASCPRCAGSPRRTRPPSPRATAAMVDRIIAHADALDLPLLSPREADRRGGAVHAADARQGRGRRDRGRAGGRGLFGRQPRQHPAPVARHRDRGAAIDAVFDIVRTTMTRRRRRFAGKGANRRSIRKRCCRGALDLGASLLSGNVRIVDCTAPLGRRRRCCACRRTSRRTPPSVVVHKISEYDGDGPFWAWNWLELGEHSGTHFDAPHHWLSGKDFPDGFTDTLDVQRLIAPVNVIDCSAEAAADPDFLLTAAGVKAWEARHGEIGAGEWVVMRTDWDKRMHDEELFLNETPTRTRTARIRPDPRRTASITCCRRGSSAGARNAWAPMPAWPASSARPTPPTTSCTATTASGWRACATSTSCRRRAPS